MDITVFDVRNVEVVKRLLAKCEDAGVQTVQIVPNEVEDIKSTPKRKRMPSSLSYAETDKFEDEVEVTTSSQSKSGKKNKRHIPEELKFPEDVSGKKISKDQVQSTKQLIIPYVHSNELVTPTKCEELYLRFMEDGYIYIKELIPPKDIIAIRNIYMQTLKGCGYLDKANKPKKSVGLTVDLSLGGFVEGKSEVQSSDMKGDAKRWALAGSSKEVRVCPIIYILVKLHYYIYYVV